MRIGIYICRTGADDEGNYQAVADYASHLPSVTTVKLLEVGSMLSPEGLAEEFKAQKFDRIVVAGDTPGYFKPLFTRALAMAGGNPDEIRLASFREHSGTVANPAERAKAIVACAAYGIPFPLAAVPDTTTIAPATLVIGAGVAGIQAALEIADAGKKVYLVERTGTIGGHMAMFDKTFPTLDCAACILTPKMVSVGQHAMIELITNAEVQQVRGGPGAYTVTINKKARRVDEKACVACNVCTEVCPAQVSSEFDSGIAERKAVYMPFPQAVPNAYLIDAANCIYVQSEGKRCGVCAKKCPKSCIDLNQGDTAVDIAVGQIIVATGYEVLDATRIERYGYGVLPNVLTALEFERLTNASGPTGGKIVTRTKTFNKRKKQDEWVFDPESPAPKRVAIIHCVGSRDAKHNEYCSRVCCMYSLKFAHLVKEKLPGAECYEFYIDMRAFGKGYEEFAERIKAEGTFVVRGRTATVTEQNGQMIVKGEDIINDKFAEFPVDMVLLAVGLVPATGSRELARMLGLSVEQDGWFRELNYNGAPTDTESGGVFIAGACQAPKDIPDTVAQASAAAAGVLKNIAQGRGLGSRNSLSLNAIETRAQELARA